MPPHTFFDSRNVPGILLFRVGNGLCSSCGWLFDSCGRLRRSLGLPGLLRSLGVRRFMNHELCFVTITGGDLGLSIGKMRRALGVGPAENRSVDSGWQEKYQGYRDRSFQHTYLFLRRAITMAIGQAEDRERSVPGSSENQLTSPGPTSLPRRFSTSGFYRDPSASPSFSGKKHSLFFSRPVP